MNSTITLTDGRLIGIAGLMTAFALAALALFLDPYLLHLAIITLLYAYMGVAWNILGGLTGQLSLGHALYVGTAAYLSSYLFVAFGVSPWLGLLVGSATSAALGMAIGAACFRYGVRGHFFALATLAFAEVGRILVLNTDRLGGANGFIIPFKGHAPWLWQFESKSVSYLIILGMTLAGIGIFMAISRSTLGYRMRAVREDEVAAEASGIDSFRTKLIAIAISSALAGAAGVFIAQYNLYVHPDSVFGIGLSIQIVLGVTIGGMGTVIGPLIGSLLLTTISEVSRTYFGEYTGIHLATYGLLLMIVVLIAPKGIVGATSALFARRGWRQSQFRRKSRRTVLTS